jgi:integrase
MARAHTVKLRATGARHPMNIEEAMKRCCSDWLNKRLESIDSVAVSARYVGVAKERGPVAASNWAKALRCLFAEARREHGWNGTNPVTMKVPTPRPRSRILTRDEIKRLRASIDKKSEPWKSFFTLLLLTGARRGNVAKMKLEDLNLAEGWWTVPGKSLRPASHCK